MKIFLCSDLHTEISEYPYKAPEGTDVIVAAGDISVGAVGPAVLRSCFGPDIPIVYCNGNHEFYRKGMQETREKIKEESKIFNVNYLENDVCVIDDVLFIGATLWTDFCLWGEEFQPLCMLTAKNCMNDYRLINYKNDPWEKFTPKHSLAEHKKSIEYIEQQLNLVGNKKVVVVTHMGPHEKSTHPKYMTGQDKFLSAAYNSNLSKLIEKYQPNLWLHGHVHDSFDYKLGETRVLTNPRGYANRYHREDCENKSFNPNLLIEV